VKKNKAVPQSIQRRLELERWERRQVQKANKRSRRARRTSSTSSSQRPTKRRHLGRTPGPTVDIVVPKVLDLNGGHSDACQLVESVRSAVRDGQSVCLLFDHVDVIRSSALTYLLAQIHKLRLEHGVDRVTGTYPTSNKIERLLSQSGFYSLLEVKNRPQATSPSRVTRYIKFKSDNKLDASIISPLRDELLRTDLSMPTLVAKTVYRAMTEAMTNVGHHAYATKSVRVASLRDRWWVFATLNVVSNMFVLVFYDVGVGIPKTLPRKYTMEMIRGVLSMLPGFLPDDGQMIAAAMEIGRTRTDLDNRGKGLVDLARLIDRVGAGKMQIFSRNGSYTYSGGKSSYVNGPGFLEGTLIEWRLPLDRALNALPEGLHAEANDDA
jgi:hypothetical protein